AMRAWVRTDRLTGLDLTTGDIISAIQAQNVQAPVGRIGARPISDDQQLQLSIQTQGRLTSVEQFRNIVLRTNPDGSVLPLGIVVDDAIVVVENVEHVMEHHPELSPAEATKRAMAEITAPIIAITLVLLSVFVPVAFIPGISGELFRQFAVTVAVSMFLSAINALTLSPALCGIFLRPRHGPRRGPIGMVMRAIDW